MPEWQDIDADMTPMRSAVCELQRKLEIGSDEAFNCLFFNNCCQSLTGPDVELSKGDWSYVGRQYGQAIINGTHARLLFVAMERPKSSCDSETFEQTQRAFRTSCKKRENPHMGGTDVLLQDLLDSSTTRDDRCQQFALTNSVRCRPVANDARSKSTRTMMKSCRNHTSAIISVLRPDVIVTQGSWGPRKQIKSLFKPTFVYRTDNGKTGRHIRDAEVHRGNGIIFLFTAHPANHPGFAWKNGPLPCYLRDAIREVRKLYSLDHERR